MSKRGVAYVKPEEPNFLKELKKQIGYKEGPTVDTKREQSEEDFYEDREENQEEQPQVVVLAPGDLTAEEAAREKHLEEKAVAEEPADLSTPIVFKPRAKKTSSEDQIASCKRSSDSVDSKKSKKSKTNPKSLLSFDEEEEEDDDD